MNAKTIPIDLKVENHALRVAKRVLRAEVKKLRAENLWLKSENATYKRELRDCYVPNVPHIVSGATQSAGGEAVIERARR
jgi:hypothetical protein